MSNLEVDRRKFPSQYLSSKNHKALSVVLRGFRNHQTEGLSAFCKISQGTKGFGFCQSYHAGLMLFSSSGFPVI